MSSSKRNGDSPRSPELRLLAEALSGQLPLATAVSALLSRPVAARLRDDFTASLRGRWEPPDDAAPWVAAAYGLADPRDTAPRAYERGERFVARLRRSPAHRRPGIVRKARQKATNPAVLDLLIGEASRVQRGDPAGALGWLNLARLIAAALGGTGFPRFLVDTAHLRLAAHFANAHRLAGDLPEAKRIFAALATDPRWDTLVAPTVRAELLSLEASLRLDLRQCTVAEHLLERAERLCLAVGDNLGAACAVLKRGSAWEYAGDGERAVRFHRRAAELLDPKAEPSLHLMAQMNLAHTLANLGRGAEATGIIEGHRQLLERHNDAPDHVRRLWVEAHVARSLDRLGDAARLLIEVRNGWLELSRPYEAELATLDSATLQVARGDWLQARRQAEQVAPALRARGVQREAQAALRLVERAAAES